MAKSRGNTCRINVNNMDRTASNLLKTSLIAAYASVLLCIVLDGVTATTNFKSVLQINPKAYTNSYIEYQYLRGVHVRRRDYSVRQHRFRFTRTTIPEVDKLDQPNMHSSNEEGQEVQCYMKDSFDSGNQRNETNYNTITLKMSVNEENKLLAVRVGFSEDTLSSCYCFNRSLTELKCNTKNAQNIGFGNIFQEGIKTLSATHNNFKWAHFKSRDDLLFIYINNKFNAINISVLMEDLTELDLSWNELSELDISRSNLNYLSNLDVSHNKLEKFSSKRFQIKVLNMSRNYIKNIYFVSILTALEQLDLSYNKITFISSKTFHGLSELKHLHLTHNYIVDTTFVTYLNKKICTIHLSNNLIENVLTHLSTEFISLKAVYLDNNVISDYDFSRIPFYMDTLNLNNNNISKVTGIYKSDLRDLYLARNSLSNIKFISSMKNLKYIDLSNNNLQNIDYEVVLHSPFTELKLDNANLSSINFISESLDKIKILDLNNNKISCFPFSKMKTKHSRLSIDNNPLENLLCPSAHRERLSNCTVSLYTKQLEDYTEIFWKNTSTNEFLSCLKRQKVLETCHQKLCSGVKSQSISYYVLIVSYIFFIVK